MEETFFEQKQEFYIFELELRFFSSFINMAFIFEKASLAFLSSELAENQLSTCVEIRFGDFFSAT